MRLTFQAAGFAGGWTNIFNDTESELQANAIAALRSAGLAPSTVVVEADEWDATARVLYDKFTYRLTATIDTNMPVAQALGLFSQTIQSIAGFPATVSNLTAGAGGAAQPLPNSNPFPNIGAGVASVGASIGDGLKKIETDLAAALGSSRRGSLCPSARSPSRRSSSSIIFLKVEK
jgi:hypothetical protein